MGMKSLAMLSIILTMALLIAGCRDQPPAERTYTVVYDGNGNTGGSVPVDSTLYKAGAQATVASNTGNLYRTSYVFADWNTAPDGSSTDYAAVSILAIGSADVTLYAKWQPGIVSEYSQLVGPEGGTVSCQGASVMIPAGALGTTTEIAMTTYESDTCMNGTFGISPFLSGVRLLPDGLVFASPASITLPLEVPLVPGGQYDVFTYDQANDCWTQLGDPAVCGTDGYTLNYTADHFSTHGGSGLRGGSISDFSDQLEATGDADSAFAKFKDDFINGRHVFDMRLREGSTCYRFCGIEFDVMYSYNGVEGQFVDNLVGERSDKATVMNYSQDHSTGGGLQIVSAVAVHIYFEESPCEKPQVPSIFVASQVPSGTSYSTNPWLKTSVSIPDGLPSYNGFLLSSSPHGGAEVSIVNGIDIWLGGDVMYTHIWPTGPGSLGISSYAMQQMEGKTVRVEFWNCYQPEGASCMGGTTEVWIIYSP